MDTSNESNHASHDDQPNSGIRAISPWILVADPHDDSRCRIADALRADGYTVVEAVDSIELLDYLSAPLPDRDIVDDPGVVIMALWMPGVSGLSILGALRDAGWLVPVVLLTDPLPCETRRVYRHLGANVIMEQPFDVNTLRAVVRRLARRPIRNDSWYGVLQHAAPAQAIPDEMYAEAG